MSAGFRTSYYDILKRNISHIYSGQPPTEIRLRVTSYHEDIDPIKRHYAKRPTSYKGLPLRYYEYLPEYNAVLPKAKGFQNLSSRGIRKLVTRLSHHNPSRALDDIEAVKNSNLPSTREETRSAPLRGRHSSMSRQQSENPRKLKAKNDMDDSVNKLNQGETNPTKTRKRDKNQVT